MMVHQCRNVFLSLRSRESGFRGRNRRNILLNFAEEIAATSSTDNNPCFLPGAPRCTFLVTFSYDHSLVASSHGNHTINISRLTTGEHVQTLKGHPRSPWCVTFHPSSNEILASGCLGGEVRVWDLQGSSEVWQSDNHSMIASLSFHPRDQVLAIATSDRILLWDWRQPVPFASVSISSPLEKVRLVRFSPLGHNLLTGIANPPVDEEEPEYENLDLQHEAYQNASRPRHGVPEHLSPYPRPARNEPTFQGSYSTGLSSSAGPSTSQEPARSLSPGQRETLEEAREYAAAMTLSALGLRRVNPARSSSRHFPDSVWQTGSRSVSNEQSRTPENLFWRGVRDQSGSDSNVSVQNDPIRQGNENGDFGGRSGMRLQNRERSSDETGDASRVVISEDWISINASVENAVPGYVNTNVTNGEEVRVARTSVNGSRVQTSESRSDGSPHIAQIQQLPTSRTPEVPNGTSTVTSSNCASAESGQEVSALGGEVRLLDLASSSVSLTVPTTNLGQESLPNIGSSPNLTNAQNQDCHSPEAKRHCPDLSTKLQVPKRIQENPSQSYLGPSTSSATKNLDQNGHTARQKLSFSDAVVSSALQEVGPSTSGLVLPDSEIASSSSSKSETSLENHESRSGSTNSCQLTGESSSLDPEFQMQPALQSETLTEQRAEVMHRIFGTESDQPHAFTARLGTIPHTAPPLDDGSQSDSNVDRISNGTPERMSSFSQSQNNLSRWVNNSSSQVPNNPSNSPTISGEVPSSNANSSHLATVSFLHQETNHTNPDSSNNLSRSSGFGSGAGSERGAESLHFGQVASEGNSNNPLDLSKRTSRSNHSEAHSPDENPSSQINNISQHCPGSTTDNDNTSSTSVSSSQSQGGVSLPPAAHQSSPLIQHARNMTPLQPQTRSEHQASVPQGMDLTISHAAQGTWLRPAAQTSTTPRTSSSFHPDHNADTPEQFSGSNSTVQPSNPFPPSDTAVRYRRYNLWRSPGLHRQRSSGITQEAQEGESTSGDNPDDETRVVYGARRVAPLHTRRHLHIALLNQPSRQLTEMERMDMAARVQRRMLRQSRQGPLRAQLGRLSAQLSSYHPRNSIFDENYQPPPPMIHATINRAIASAFAGRGETAVANNIGNTTYRLQWWDFSEFELPDISDVDHNVVVPHCKLHNDASCDVSQDGRLLAAFVPSPLGFPDDGVLAIHSLMPHNFGDVLYTKSFGPNAITVNISPLGNFVVVGLASRKLHLHMAWKQLIGMIFKLHKEGAAEDSLLYVCDVEHACSDTERRHHVSVNTVKWIPRPGGGLVYGTNRGHLRICSPSNFTAPDDLTGTHGYHPDYAPIDDCPRHDLVHRRRSYTYMCQEFGLRNLGLHTPGSSGAGVGTAFSGPERRARGTQTPQRELFSTATQTD